MFFNDFQGLGRTLVVGVLAYISLVTFLRISGNRTLSKLNAFDLVVTVALGSTLATMLLTRDVALAEGALGLAVLIGLQFVVTWMSVRVPFVRKAVRGEPSLLLHRGKVLTQSLRKSRLTEGELLAAIRQAGIANLSDLEAVVLETDGSISVVRKDPSGISDSLVDLPRLQDQDTPA